MTAPTERTVKLAVVVAGALALLGMAWESKADARDVDAIGRDVRDIKQLVCRQYPTDSLCRDHNVR